MLKAGDRVELVEGWPGRRATIISGPHTAKNLLDEIMLASFGSLEYYEIKFDDSSDIDNFFAEALFAV